MEEHSHSISKLENKEKKIHGMASEIQMLLVTTMTKRVCWWFNSVEHKEADHGFSVIYSSSTFLQAN